MDRKRLLFGRDDQPTAVSEVEIKRQLFVAALVGPHEAAPDEQRREFIGDGLEIEEIHPPMISALPVR